MEARDGQCTYARGAVRTRAMYSLRVCEEWLTCAPLAVGVTTRHVVRTDEGRISWARGKV